MTALAIASGELLALAIAAALSPVAPTMTIMLLGAARGVRLGLLFALGWNAGLLASVTLFVLVGSAVTATETSGQGMTIPPVIGIVGGLLLIVFGTVKWFRSGGRAEESAARWLRLSNRATPTRALMGGVVLAIAIPKNIAIAIAAGLILGQMPVPVIGIVALLVAFTLIGGSTVTVPALLFSKGSERTRSRLVRLQETMAAHSGRISAVILALVGLILLVVGLLDLEGA
jgi:threonine/homoserine/homoserine lactone efflux protein